MAGYLPASESDLYRSRPGSNRSGVFPRPDLLGQEKVVYETRPKLVSLHPILVLAPIPLDVLLLLVLIVALATESPSDLPFALAGVGLFLFLALIPLLYAVYSWRQTAYALTDQRVVVARGSSFETATYDEIDTVTMKARSSRVVFHLNPLPLSAPNSKAKPRNLTWVGVPGAPGVAAYAKSAAGFYKLKLRQRLLRQGLVTASMVDRIACDYCGGMIDVASLEPDKPRCPYCSAPIRVLPTGL